MRGFIRNLACSICKSLGGTPPEVPTLEQYDRWVRSQVGTIERHEIEWGELVKMLREHEIEPMLTHRPDYKKRYVDEATLMKMLPYLTYPADYYVAELEIVCDDYARWAAADARRIFHVSGVFEVWGQTSLGYHAFNLAVVAPDAYVLWEPNACFPFAGELFVRGGGYNYQPDKWK